MSTLLEPAINTRAIQGAGSPHVIVRVKEQHLAVPSQFVNQLILMPEVTKLPQAPAEVRGVLQVRGQLMPLLDLRVLFGMPSFVAETQEVVQLLHDREQDHRNWLTDLQASVEQKRPFTLARNPHQCKFGKWYDSYQPHNVSVAFLAAWRSLDTPHCRIHAIADRVCDFAERGDFAGAQAIIDATRESDMKEIVRHFEQLRTLLRQTSREVAMVLRDRRRQVAAAVDEVVAIELIDPSAVENLSELHQSANVSLTPQVAKRHSNNGQVALMLDADRLFERAKAQVQSGN